MLGYFIENQFVMYFISLYFALWFFDKVITNKILI